MELIEARPLMNAFAAPGRSIRVPPSELQKQVTSALAAAEKHGLVHRDLKPANLMLVTADVPEVIGSDQSGSSEVNYARCARADSRGEIIDFGWPKLFHTATDLKS